MALSSTDALAMLPGIQLGNRRDLGAVLLALLNDEIGGAVVLNGADLDAAKQYVPLAMLGDLTALVALLRILTANVTFTTLSASDLLTVLVLIEKGHLPSLARLLRALISETA